MTWIRRKTSFSDHKLHRNCLSRLPLLRVRPHPSHSFSPRLDTLPRPHTANQSSVVDSEMPMLKVRSTSRALSRSPMDIVALCRSPLHHASQRRRTARRQRAAHGPPLTTSPSDSPPLTHPRPPRALITGSLHRANVILSCLRLRPAPAPPRTLSQMSHIILAKSTLVSSSSLPSLGDFVKRNSGHARTQVARLPRRLRHTRPTLRLMTLPMASGG